MTTDAKKGFAAGCGGCLVLVVMASVVIAILPLLGMSVIISIDYLSSAFSLIGVHSPAVGWLIVGILAGALAGLTGALKRVGRGSNRWKVYGGAAGLFCLLLLGAYWAPSSAPVGSNVGHGPTATPELTPTPSPPDKSAPQGMIYVQGGEFQMGDNSSEDEYGKPAHNVKVTHFYIDVNEVTCEAYEEFIKATGHRTPPEWVNRTCLHGASRKPVTGVDWHDAKAYAHWAGKRLPAEEEWEFAARGTTGWRYPWGNEWRGEAANTAESNARGLVNVGSYPDGNSPAGVMDLIGNAWEWTASDLNPYPGGKLTSRPRGAFKVIRGGSWREDRNQATTTYRGYLLISGSNDYSATGFRCVKNVTSPLSVFAGK